MDWFLAPIAAGFPMSPLEILAVIFGLWSVWCCVKESIWSWPTGLLNVLLSIGLFWHAKLYADTALQVIYVGLQLYGWWQWLHGGANRSPLTISRTSGRLWGALALITVVAYVPMGLALDHWTDSDVPWWDALPTVTSLIAQWMLTKKKLENWMVWIITDCIYIPLYVYKHLYLIAGLYVVFMFLCFLGWRAWRRTSRFPAAA